MLVQLWMLDLTDCGIEENKTKRIAGMLEKNKGIQSLVLEENDVGVIGVMSLFESLKVNSTLKSLSLKSNGLNGDVVQVIASAFEEHPESCLEFLDLSCNEMFHDDKDVEIFFKSLEDVKVLGQLLLDNNGISNESVLSIAQGIKANRSLDLVGLTGNDINVDGWKILERFVGKDGKVVVEWTTRRHHKYPAFFRDQVMTLMLMWNHDQYDLDECDFEWNMLPMEVLERIVRYLAVHPVPQNKMYRISQYKRKRMERSESEECVVQ